MASNTEQFEHFISTTMGDKDVTAIPGIGRAFGEGLGAHGINMVWSVYYLKKYDNMLDWADNFFYKFLEYVNTIFYVNKQHFWWYFYLIYIFCIYFQSIMLSNFSYLLNFYANINM